MKQNYINHIVFVLDGSGSMRDLVTTVEKVFTNQIAYLAQRSTELDQETRVSIYIFDEKVECLIYDKDVMRLPKIQSYARGMTALLDATKLALDDLADTPQKYGDHAFLVYVLTDGQENASRHTAANLKKHIENLADNWTLAVLVPDQNGVHESKKFGFPANNISVWSTTSKGVEEVGNNIRKATESFMNSRSQGVRGTRNLFELDTSNLTMTTVKGHLQELKLDQYHLYPVQRDSAIKDLVEAWSQQSYRKGSAYYLLTKTEEIQGYKQLCVQHKTTGKVYSGVEARQMLGLPTYTVKVGPDTNADFDIFVQSTSTNRKLLAGTKVIVLV